MLIVDDNFLGFLIVIVFCFLVIIGSYYIGIKSKGTRFSVFCRMISLLVTCLTLPLVANYFSLSLSGELELIYVSEDYSEIKYSNDGGDTVYIVYKDDIEYVESVDVNETEIHAFVNYLGEGGKVVDWKVIIPVQSLNDIRR